MGANAITASVSLTLTENSVPLLNWVESALSLNQAGSRVNSSVQSVLTGPGAALNIVAGTVGYCMIKNLDTSTNQVVYLLTGAAGTKFAQLAAGEIALFKFGPDITAPYIAAQSTACQVKVAVLEL